MGMGGSGRSGAKKEIESPARITRSQYGQAGVWKESCLSRNWMTATATGTGPEYIRQIEDGPGMAKERPFMIEKSAGVIYRRPGEIGAVECCQGPEPFR